MNNFNNQAYPISSARGSETLLMQRVAYLLATSLLVTAAAARYADVIGLGPGAFFPLAIGTIVCVVILNLVRTNALLGLLLLYVFSVLEGLLIGPMLGAIARNYPYGASIIGEAAGLSAFVMGSAGIYVWISNKDFSSIGRYLFWGLLALIGFGILRFFIANSPGITLIYGLAGAAIFTGFALYDFSNIKRRYGPNDYVPATVSLYLDFLNLFLSLLQVLMALSGGGSSRRS